MQTDTQHNCDEEYRMPGAEALLAGTLALMTAHVQACCDNHRGLMAGKVIGNLTLLSQHPSLSAEFRTMLWNLRLRWRAQLEQGGSALPSVRDQRLWHTGPVSIQ